MNPRKHMLGFLGRLTLGLVLIGFNLVLPPAAQSQPLNSNDPATTQRLVFIHHSVGEALLNPSEGNLRQALNDHNYYVADTNYAWGLADPYPGGSETIGDHTDIGQWYNWFLGPNSSTYLTAGPPNGLYTTDLFTDWLGPNSITDPGGPNTIVLFKSCFPNAQIISGNTSDAPRQSSASDPNPIWGKSSGEDVYYTVSNIKGLYRDLLQYFATRQDKLFILLTTPPSHSGTEGLTEAAVANARAIHTWLVRHWLDGYPHNNVAVFDFFNVLTSNGGNADTNDLGWAAGNHHRLWQGQVQHIIGLNSNYLAYPSPPPVPGEPLDNHPTAAGHQKAAGEFIPLLNVAYHAWKGTGGRPLFMGRSPKTAPLSLLLLD